MSFIDRLSSWFYPTNKSTTENEKPTETTDVKNQPVKQVDGCFLVPINPDRKPVAVKNENGPTKNVMRSFYTNKIDIYKHAASKGMTSHEQYKFVKDLYNKNRVEQDAFFDGFYENLFSETNHPIHSRVQLSTGFAAAWIHAYNNHRDLVINPDDLMFLIDLQFTKLINKDPEAVRSLFVDHEGKKKLVVNTGDDNEYQWDNFFEQIIEQIRKNTKGDIKDILVSDFSTTKRFDHIMSTAVVMDCFKAYFEYCRYIPCCGFRNVLFEGTLLDYKKIVDKLTYLRRYPFFEQYVDHMIPIINKFVDAISGNVDLDFFDRVMNQTEGTNGSGGDTTYYTGWFTHLFGLYGGGNTYSDLTTELVDVEIKVEDHMKGINYTARMVGGFVGYNDMDNVVRPCRSLEIYKDLNTVTKLC